MKTLLTLLTFSLAAFAPAWAQSGQPVDITSQKLEVDQAANTATFSGNVVVTQGSLTLNAPRVVAASAAAGGVTAITASGGVTITRPGTAGISEKATGTTATYNPQAGTLTLTGAVTLTRGPSELSGDKLVYNLQTGNAVVTNSQGPVKARFVPQN